jgi:hypothetical protein
MIVLKSFADHNPAVLAPLVWIIRVTLQHQSWDQWPWLFKSFLDGSFLKILILNSRLEVKFSAAEANGGRNQPRALL